MGATRDYYRPGIVTRSLAGAVTQLCAQRVSGNQQPVWQAWTPSELVLLFETEHEEVARILFMLLGSQFNAQPILLKSPKGAESYYIEERWSDRIAAGLTSAVVLASDRCASSEASARNSRLTCL